LKDPDGKLGLPDVTLAAVTSVAIAATIEALKASMRQADFGEVLLLTDQAPPCDADSSIGWRQIDRLESRVDYSRFMLRTLADHIGTKHVLCVQWDGFVLRGDAWSSRFLDYDYIGAVWPHFDDSHNVGNGGFSLRSRRLLEACKELPFDGSEAEDIVIGRLCRAQLEQQGIRFAPASLARQFAYERTPATGREFGFHGAFNLVRVVPTSASLDLLRALEPGMLARNERWEILRWALGHGRRRLAYEMLLRLL